MELSYETIVIAIPIWIVWIFIVLIATNAILKITQIILERQVKKLREQGLNKSRRPFSDELLKK